MLKSWQDKLIFHAVPPNPFTEAAYRPSELWLHQPTHKLHGWKIEQPRVAHSSVLLYFGGNAEDISLNIAQLPGWPVKTAYLFNYRGYGLSQGKPSQAALYEDALAIHDFLVQAQGVKPEDIVVFGRSLGSAVATYLASQRPVGKAVLVTPFDSILALARKLFPFLPVRWLLHHPFPSSDHAATVTTPMLMILAGQDEIIPKDNSLALYQAWAGPKQLRIIEQAGHNDLHLNPAYEEAIDCFLRQA